MVPGSNPGVPSIFVIDSPMAQSVARQAVNLQVAGSNPAGGDTFPSERAFSLVTWKTQKSVDTEGFEPSTSRMRNGRSSTELSALLAQQQTPR
jgi:hypothetical protein